MTLSTHPRTVEKLITVIREKCKPRLDFDFSLQQEDPDFGRQFCFLTDFAFIAELPEKALLKVHRAESDASSAATSVGLTCFQFLYSLMLLSRA